MTVRPEILHWWGGLVIKCGAAVFSVGFLMAAVEFYEVNSSRIESWMHPVVIDWQFHDWSKDDDKKWSVSVQGNKVRAECIYDAEQSPVVLIQTALAPAGKEVALEFANPLPKGSSRPPGVQDFGRWIVNSQALNKGDKLTFAFRHKCHDGHPVTTVMGPIRVGYAFPSGVDELPAE